jgi:hypothetical protein
MIGGQRAGNAVPQEKRSDPMKKKTTTAKPKARNTAKVKDLSPKKDVKAGMAPLFDVFRKPPTPR